MSHNLSDKFIIKRFGYASHQNIKYIWIYIGLPKYISKFSHHFHDWNISKRPRLPFHLNVYTELLDTGTCFHLDFSFSKMSPVENLPLTSPFLMQPPDIYLDIPQY